MCPDNSTDQILIMSRYYSTGHGHCSTYTCINCMQYGRFPWKIHIKNAHVNSYTSSSSFFSRLFYIKYALKTCIFACLFLHKCFTRFFLVEFACNMADFHAWNMHVMLQCPRPVLYVTLTAVELQVFSEFIGHCVLTVSCRSLCL